VSQKGKCVSHKVKCVSHKAVKSSMKNFEDKFEKLIVIENSFFFFLDQAEIKMFSSSAF
jgi:hypothetical protein